MTTLTRSGRPNTSGTRGGTPGQRPFPLPPPKYDQNDEQAFRSQLGEVIRNLTNKSLRVPSWVPTVVDFGAKGDNATDDLIAIQAASDSLPDGGWLHFPIAPGGAYRTTDTWTFNKPLVISGEGPGSLVRCVGVGTRYALFVDGTAGLGGFDTIQGVHIRDMAFATEAGNSGAALRFDRVNHSRVDNVVIPSAATTGWLFQGSQYVTSTNVYISAATAPYSAGVRATPQYGVLLTPSDSVVNSPSGHNTFVNLQIEGCDQGDGVGLFLNAGVIGSQGSSHNTFIGGNAVTCNYGVFIVGDSGEDGSCMDTFIDFVTEENNTKDIDCDGIYCQFINTQARSVGAPGGILFRSQSVKNQIVGGRYRSITINGSAKNIAIYGANIHASSIADSGTDSTWRDVFYIDGPSFLRDQILPTNLPAGTTANAPLRWIQGAAPTSPVDGDMWREDNTNTGLKVRINGVTKTVVVA